MLTQVLYSIMILKKEKKQNFKIKGRIRIGLHVSLLPCHFISLHLQCFKMNVIGKEPKGEDVDNISIPVIKF